MPPLPKGGCEAPRRAGAHATAARGQAPLLAAGDVGAARPAAAAAEPLPGRTRPASAGSLRCVPCAGIAPGLPARSLLLARCARRGRASGSTYLRANAAAGAGSWHCFTCPASIKASARTCPAVAGSWSCCAAPTTAALPPVGPRAPRLGAVKCTHSSSPACHACPAPAVWSPPACCSSSAVQMVQRGQATAAQVRGPAAPTACCGPTTELGGFQCSVS